jgi:large subunit ribosomal protein L25
LISKRIDRGGAVEKDVERKNEDSMSTDAVSLKADVREKSGSNQSNRLRKEGKLPAVVYGHKQEPMSISLSAHEFIIGLHHGQRLFTLEMAGKKDTVLLKDVQYDYLGKDVIHADLIRVDLSERVTVEVALDFRGVAKGTTMGGILEESMTSIEIECGVTSIPDIIAVNVRELGLNDAIHARDIVLPSGTTLITDPNALVAICHESKAAEAAVVAEPTEGAATEPEVITERKKEEAAE